LLASGTAALTVGACGQQSQDVQEGTANESGGGGAGEPQRGGTLRVALPASPTTLDPALSFVFQDFLLSGVLYERLTLTRGPATVEPALATAWEASEDGLRWTFTLREGVTFHDGSPFGAEDVVYTFERVLDPDMGSLGYSLLNTVTDVTAVDDLTVQFDLARPSVDFPILISYSNVGIVPRGRSSEELAERPVGTGSFRFAEYIPGERLRMVRNEDYWQPDLPYLDELQHVYIPEAATRLQALSSRAVDMIWNLPLEQIPTVESTADLRLEEIPEASYQHIILNQNFAPLDDPQVREALKLSVDRQGVLQAAAQGRGTIANDQPIPPWYTHYADIPSGEQDITRARELLAEAGYADGLTLDMATSAARPGMLETAIAFQEMAQQANITINLERLSNDIYWNEYLNYPLALSNNSYIPPSMDGHLNLTFHSNGLWNETFYVNPELDDLIEKVNAEATEEQRADLYAQIQQIISTEGAWIIPYYRSTFMASRNTVHGVQTSPDLLLDMSAAWIEQEG
jgi:peptide/nickel transport system substrate-binding protein